MAADAGEPVEVVVGVVGRAHGIRGEVVVESRTDSPELRFAPGQVLYGESDRRVLTVAGERHQNGRLLISFGEIGDRTAAEALAGTVLVVDVDPAARPADAEEYYDRQLVGLRVHDAAGLVRGVVVGVLHLPEQDVLEVETANGVRLVPFVAAIVPHVDIGSGRIAVAEVPGLLDAGEE